MRSSPVFGMVLVADGSDRQRAYRDRMKERGLVQVSFLVPAVDLEPLKRLAARMRDRHLAASEPTDD